MKIFVYFLYCQDNDDILKKIDAFELDPTFEKKTILWSIEKKKELFYEWKKTSPGVFVTIHTDFEPFFCFNELGYEYRRRWLYYKTIDDFQPKFIYNCYTNYIFNHTNDVNPLLSVITSTYKSKHRILRPYHSLLHQTYKNWEWIIIDDTDGEETENQWDMLEKIEQSDIRIRVYKGMRHNGYIGAMKKMAAGLAYGEWLIEMDHDDDIVPELFQWIVDASRKYKEATFIYSDCIETFEDNLQAHSYGEFFGMGYGAYYTCLYKNNFQHVCRSVPINRLTMSHIVGVPNHIRCWKTSFYHQINGHNQNLPVADDYELIVRTILESNCWVRISEMCYIQYRNRNGNNFTFIRNQLIQDLVRIISQKYSDQLDVKFQKLLKDENAKLEYLSKPIFKFDHFKMPIFEKTFSPKNEMFSIIIPTYNRPEHLLKAIQSVINQTFSNWTLYIIGDKCPILNQIMDVLRLQTKYDERIRWWNLSENNGAGGAIPRNYGLYLAYTEWIAYLDDDNTWDPDHLQSCVDIIEKNENVSYLFSSFKIDGNSLITDVPVKGSLDTSCIVHKHDLIFKYGLWKDRTQAGYAHDFEFFSRWKNEKWIATKKPTMNYSTEFNSQSFESIRELYFHHKTLFDANQ